MDLRDGAPDGTAVCMLLYLMYAWVPSKRKLGYLVGSTIFFFKISIFHDLESAHQSPHRWAGKTSEALVVRFQPTRPHFFPAYKLHMNKFFICCILYVNLHFHLLKEAYPSKNNRFGRRRRGEKMYVL